jgi:hypothetical protein
MEIGISSQQLIDIGLNVAGIMAAAALLMLIRSFFTGRKEQPAAAVVQKAPSVKTESETAPKKRPILEQEPIEYIDLAGINWNLKKDTVPKKPVENLDSPNRRRVISLAKKLLANAHEIRQQKLAEADQKFFSGKAEMIREGAGR